MSEPKANCPWCGCEPTTVEQGIAWGCGSYKKGIEPWQSQNCQLNVAEDEVERLQDDMRTAWGIIANAYGGDWAQASDEWKAAATRWRDEVWGRVASSVGDGRPEEATA